MTMSKQIYRIDSYKFDSTDTLLFDTNIWLYLYSPQGMIHPLIKSKYASAFGRIRSAKSRILVDVLVLSEFINAYSRFVYNELPAATKPSNFKTFRSSVDFKAVAEEISKYSQRILGKTEPTESGFESINLRAMLNDYAAGKTDFNDQILAEMCKSEGAKTGNARC